MNVIGISGLAGAGKNTVAGLLAAELTDRGYVAAIDGLAVGIKRRMRDSGWDGKKDDAARRQMQRIGTDARGCDPDFWIKELVLRHTDSRLEFLIVPDVRYPNEVNWTFSRGVCWRVEGRGGLAGPAGQHASETALAGCPFPTVIDNSGTIEQLIPIIRKLVDEGRHLRP